MEVQKEWESRCRSGMRRYRRGMSNRCRNGMSRSRSGMSIRSWSGMRRTGGSGEA